MTNEAHNGFFACVSALRHAFRGGTIPVVKVAQLDKIINYPTGLDLLWSFICQRYGITSLGGNVIATFHCNMDHARRKVASAIHETMPEPIDSAEYYLIYASTELERKALPVYYYLEQSIKCYEMDQKHACVAHLQRVVGSKMPRHVFAAYIQGFYSWAAGVLVHDEYVECDGASGAHPRALTVQDLVKHVDGGLREKMIRTK